MKPAIVVATVTAGVLLTVAGCGPAEQAAPTLSPSASASPSQPSEPSEPTHNPASPAEIIEQVFEEMENQESLAQTVGLVPDISLEEFPAHVSVTSIVANDSSTQLRFVLSSESADEMIVALEAFNEAHPLAKDIRDVAIEDESLGIRLLSLIGVPDGESMASGSFCICSGSPKTIDDQGVTLDATFGPLEQDTIAVTVVIPGFDPMTDVPVTWQ